MAAGHAVAAPSRRELRRFGLVVGGAFAVLGSLSAWRGHAVPPLVLGTLAAALLVAALLAPRALAPVERRWMAAAEALGRFNTRVLLTLLYVFLFTPVGVVRRALRDPLDRRLRDGRPTSWVPRDPTAAELDRYRHQF